MTNIPPLKSREVIKGLEALGFENVRQKGSHAIFHHQDCRRAAVPIHPTKTMSRYLLSCKPSDGEHSEICVHIIS